MRVKALFLPISLALAMQHAPAVAANVTLGESSNHHFSHHYASEASLLNTMRSDIQNIELHDRSRVIDQLYKNSSDSINWTPSKVSVYVNHYNPDITFPAILSNQNQAGQAVARALMTLSEKDEYRFGFVGSNLFLSGNNDTNPVLSQTIAWLTKQEITSDTALNIAISQVHSSHYRDIKNWLNTHLPNAVINDFASCDYQQINACVEQMNADLVIFGGYDGSRRGAAQTDEQIAQLIAKKVPVFASLTFSHAQQSMLNKLLEHGEFSYASNFFSRAKIANYSVAELKTELKHPAAASALLRYLDDLETVSDSSRASLLDTMRSEIIKFDDHYSHHVIEQLYQGSNDTIDWTPSKVSVYVNEYNPETTFPVFISNLDKADQAITRALMTLSEKEGHRFGFVGSNLFLSGSNDTDSVLSQTIAWLTKQEVTVDTPLNIAISQTTHRHYLEIKNWLDTHLPNAVVSNYGDCDYEQINTCVEQMDADLMIFGGYDGSRRGTEQIDEQINQLIAKKVPIFTSYTFSHAKQPILSKLLEYGELSYASNFYSRAKLADYPTSELKARLKQRLEMPSALLLPYIDELDAGVFAPQYQVGSLSKNGDVVFNQGTYYRCKVNMCSRVASTSEPGVGSQWQQSWEVMPEIYTLTTSVIGQGEVSPSLARVKTGQTQQFVITPEQGHSLLMIEGCQGTLVGNTYSVSHADAACQIKAEFANNSESAMRHDDHSHASEADLLDAMRSEIAVIESSHRDAIDLLYKESSNSISWAPSLVSVYVDTYNPEFSFPVLTSNLDRGGQATSQALMILSEKNEHRFGFVGSNLFMSGNNDTDSVLSETIGWLTKQNISADAPLKIAISQTHLGHYREIQNWLNTHLPNATISNFASCDYEQINVCVDEMDADLVIFGGYDSGRRGTEQTDAQIAQLIANKVPVFISYTFSHRQQPMLRKWVEHGEFSYASNYRLGAKLENYSVDELTAKLKQLPQGLAALQRYINDLETGKFDPELTLICGNFLVCNNSETQALNTTDFSMATQWLRKNMMKLDVAGIDVFSLETHRLLKLALLLADKYRLTIDYPIYPEDVQEWQRASYADSVISYARRNNIAQPDLGDFAQDRRLLEKGKGTPYAKPATLTERKTVSVPFNNQWTSTGWYALPGEAITLTRHDTGEHDVEIMLNFRRSNSNRIATTRTYWAPMGISEQTYVKRRMVLKAGESHTFSTPYGGPIYLLLSQGQGAMSADITANNIAHHPYIDDIDSPEQIARFERLLDETELPHADVKLHGYEIHLRKDRLLNGIIDAYPTMESLLKGARDEHVNVLYTRAGFRALGKSLTESFSSDYLNICRSLFGRDCLDEQLHTRPFIQHANYDQYAFCGIGCSGNPFDSSGSLSPRSWLDNHELGHGLQRHSVELSYVEEESRNKWRSYQRRSGESQNNVFAFHQYWNYHFNIDRNTEALRTRYNDKDLFFAFMSDVNGVTNSAGERVVLNASCTTFANPEGRDRYTASWSINKDAHYPLHIYMQMILQAHKLKMPDGKVLDNGFDIFTLLHQHQRIFTHYAKNQTTWLANRVRLGFGDFAFQGEALYEGRSVSHMPGNDFILISLNFMTQRDWSSLFDLAGLRYSDKAKQQAAKHATREPMPLGMYVQDRKFPGVNLSQDLIFLPLDHNDKTTRWPIDNSSPVDCK